MEEWEQQHSHTWTTNREVSNPSSWTSASCCDSSWSSSSFIVSPWEHKKLTDMHCHIYNMSSTFSDLAMSVTNVWNLHGSGMSNAKTASPKPSSGASWRVGNNAVSKGSAEWNTTKKKNHASAAHDSLMQKRLEENLCQSVPHMTQSVKGLNWIECLWNSSFTSLHKTDLYLMHADTPDSSVLTLSSPMYPTI